MNTECIIATANDRATTERLQAIAEKIKQASEHIELFPVAISKITAQTNCYKTYDEMVGYYPKQKKTVLEPGDHVLFVAGKYHYMNKTALRRILQENTKDIYVLFPDATEPFFTDIIEY